MCYCNPSYRTPCCRSVQCSRMCRQQNHRDLESCMYCSPLNQNINNSSSSCFLCRNTPASNYVNCSTQRIQLCDICYRKDQLTQNNKVF